VKSGEKKLALLLAPVVLLALFLGWLRDPYFQAAPQGISDAALAAVERREIGPGFWVGCTRKDLAETLRRTPEGAWQTTASDLIAREACAPFLPGVPVEVEADSDGLKLVRVPGATEAYWLPWESLN